jgi:hypothetical protein
VLDTEEHPLKLLFTMRAEPHRDLGHGFGHGFRGCYDHTNDLSLRRWRRIRVEVLVVLVVSLGVADAAAVDPRRVVWAPKLAVGSAVVAQVARHFGS